MGSFQGISNKLVQLLLRLKSDQELKARKPCQVFDYVFQVPKGNTPLKVRISSVGFNQPFFYYWTPDFYFISFYWSVLCKSKLVNLFLLVLLFDEARKVVIYCYKPKNAVFTESSVVNSLLVKLLVLQNAVNYFWIGAQNAQN